MGTIKLKNMQFYGYHGVYEHEKELGAPFEVDIEISKPFDDVVSTDDISCTVDYDAVYKLVQSEVSNFKYNLIETLAGKIAYKIMNCYEIEKVVVRVRKPKVQISGILDTVEVETELKK